MTAKLKLIDRDPAVRKLIGLAGGIKQLAERIGVRPASVSGWVRVPTARVLDIEKEFGGQVTRYEMRSDLFGNGP